MQDFIFKNLSEKEKVNADDICRKIILLFAERHNERWCGNTSDIDTKITELSKQAVALGFMEILEK